MWAEKKLRIKEKVNRSKRSHGAGTIRFHGDKSGEFGAHISCSAGFPPMYLEITASH